MFYVYVLQSLRDKKLYIGFSTNLRNRIKDHNSGSTKSTKPRRPFRLLYNEIIDSVEEIYHGKLTVKLNCWYKQTQFDNLLKLSWFQKLDYLGVAAYFDLTDKMDPTEEDLKKAWFNSRQGIKPSPFFIPNRF